MSLECYRDEINAVIKKIEDETGFTRTLATWNARRGQTAEERLSNWINRKEEQAR